MACSLCARATRLTADGSAVSFTSRAVNIDVAGADGTSVFVTPTAIEFNTNIGPISDNNTASNMVLENSAIGTAVGITASASDADAGETVTYLLSDDAGGLFTIDETSGEVTVNGSLDYEAGTSHDITVLTEKH